MPALLKSTSSREKASLVRANSAFTAAGSVTSVGTTRARERARPRLPRRLVQPFPAAAGEHHPVAVAEERQRGRAADAAPGPGDDGDPPGGLPHEGASLHVGRLPPTRETWGMVGRSQMASPVLFACVGGFLGAGKTSAIVAAARVLRSAGPVGRGGGERPGARPRGHRGLPRPRPARRGDRRRLLLLPLRRAARGGRPSARGHAGGRPPGGGGGKLHRPRGHRLPSAAAFLSRPLPPGALLGARRARAPARDARRGCLDSRGRRLPLRPPDRRGRNPAS